MSESDESGGRGDAVPTDLESASVYSQESLKRRVLPSNIKHRMPCGAEHCHCREILNKELPKVPPVPDFDALSSQYSCGEQQYKSDCDSESIVDDTPPSVPPVPNFDEDDDDKGCDCPMCCSREDTRLFSTQGAISLVGLFNENLMNHLCKYFSCPICHDPMAEATSTNCGHAFCSNCLKSWLKIKPVCPVCSLEVTCCIRLYNVDHVIEDAARELIKHHTNDDEMIADLSERIDLAAVERERQEKATSKFNRILKKIRQKMNEIKIFHQCKGYTGIFRTVNHSHVVTGIKQSIRRSIPSRRNVSCETSETTQGKLSPRECTTATQQSRLGQRCTQLGLLATGFFIAQTFMNLSSCKQFFWYIWLCLTKYEGVIPDYLTKDKALQPAPLDESASSSWWLWK